MEDAGKNKHLKINLNATQPCNMRPRATEGLFLLERNTL